MQADIKACILHRCAPVLPLTFQSLYWHNKSHTGNYFFFMLYNLRQNHHAHEALQALQYHQDMQALPGFYRY